MMRLLPVVFAIALVACIVVGQTPQGSRKSQANKASIDFVELRKMEREVDSRIERFDTSSPMYVVGATRASYVAGTGMVFSLEVSLAPAVGITPFFTKLKPEEVEKIYQAKKERVPMIQQLLLSALPDLVQAMPTLPANEDVVVAATMFYFPYEKLDGMPRQIVVRGQAGALRKLRAPEGQTNSQQLATIGKVLVY